MTLCDYILSLFNECGYKGSLLQAIAEDVEFEEIKDETTKSCDKTLQISQG